MQPDDQTQTGTEQNSTAPTEAATTGEESKVYDHEYTKKLPKLTGTQLKQQLRNAPANELRDFIEQGVAQDIFECRWDETKQQLVPTKITLPDLSASAVV
jgi:hypothetical protein